MIKAELLGVFGEISSDYRPGDVPRLMKKLEQQCQRFQKQDLSNLDQNDLCAVAKQGSNAYFCSLQSAKLARAVHKLIKNLPKLCEDELQNQLVIKLGTLLTSSELSDVKTLSLLIDLNQEAKRFTKSSFGGLSQLLKIILSKDLSLMSEQDSKEYLHCGAKLCIQALQLYQADIKELWRSSSSVCNEQDLQTCSDVVEVRRHWEQIVLGLISHLFQSSSRDHLLLVGTAVSMVFNSAPSPEIIETSYMGILSLLSHDQNNFEFCGIHYCRDETEAKIQDSFLPMIAMIKGLLVSCDKSTLKSRSCPLMFQVLPHIINFCKGPTTHHYLSFQVLALWCQKVEDIGALSPSVSDLQVLASSLSNTNLDFILSSTDGKNFETEHMIFAEDILKDRGNGEIMRKCDNPDKMCVGEANGPSYMSSDCPVLKAILNCIWLNWDSPVDGVSEYVLEIFQRLLKIWCRCVQDGTSSYRDLSQELFERVLSMAWHSKTRYKPLSLVLPHVDSDKVIGQNPGLKSELLQCMKTNNLASVASDTYKAFLQQSSSKSQDTEELSRTWEIVWMPVLISGLVSENTLQRLKVSTYWLEPTLTLVPDSRKSLLLCLQEKLSAGEDFTDGPDRNLTLYAWTVVSRIARENFHEYIELPLECWLRAALRSADDLVRAEAFHLLASTVKKSEPVKQLETELLLEFIPCNLKTDSASFRHSLASSLRKVLVRIRDSCLAAVRSNSLSKSYLKHGIAFVNWLYELLMSSLVPGSCYQRRQTVFDLLFVLFETLQYQEDNTSKKGKAHETADILVNYAQKEGQWFFLSRRHFLTLLICLEDGAEEIQRQSYKLLVSYFRWPSIMEYGAPSQVIVTSPEDCKKVTLLEDSNLVTSPEDSITILSNVSFVQQLMDRALFLISQPRAYENHSGLLLFSLVLHKYIIGIGMTVTASQRELNSFSLDQPKMSSTNGMCSLVDLLVDRVENSLLAVRENIAANVKLHPIHGTMQCVNRCLQFMSNNSKCRGLIQQDLALKLDKIICINYKVIDFVLDVLAGGKSIENCPSFADIGLALVSLVSEGESDQAEESTSLSPEFQLLLSWCWINLKESCSCLAAVTATLLQFDGDSQRNVSSLQSIGDKLIQVLTTFRHRGAIEGCQSGLFQYSFSLMSSKNMDLACIPRKILQKVLCSLSENSMTSSITRRSAGLLIIVQTILQTACKCGHFDLLESTVEKLYSFAVEPVPEVHSQQNDLKQSHALNILKAIFCDASLAPRVMPLLSRVVILVIEGFDSPSWAIRNAATQLISTLVTRIFGQKSKLISAGSMSLEEFEALYPDVLNFVCDRLNSHMASGGTQVKPSLYVMLTLLANVGPLPRHQFSASCREFLQRVSEFLLSSPVYSLRKLAAQVWVAMSALDQADSLLETILQHLQASQTNLNLLHGWLLCAHFIFILSQPSHTTSGLLLTFCVENPWLLRSHPLCLLIASLVLQTVQLCLVHIEGLNSELLSQLWSLIENCLTSAGFMEHALQVAKGQCLGECLKSLHILCKKSKQAFFESKFQATLADCLQSNIPELKSATLKCLHEAFSDNPSIIGEKLQCLLWNSLMISTCESDYIKTVDILFFLARSNKIVLIQPGLEMIIRALMHSHHNKTMSLSRAQFDLTGIIFRICDSKSLMERWQELTAWCDQQGQFSCPTNNENLRLSAATSLRICGLNIINVCCSHKDTARVGSCIVSIIRTSLILLEDAEDEVRQEVSVFVSQLCGYANLHYNVAYLALSEILASRLHWCVELHEFLLGLLYKEGNIKCAVANALHSEAQALFEAETQSVMSEEFFAQLWAFSSLQSIVQNYRQSCFPLISKLCEVASEELCEVIPVLFKYLNDGTIFNISNEENVLKSLHGVFLLGVLCKNMLENSLRLDNKTQMFTFVNEVTKLEEIYGLHPFLQNKFFETDQPIVCNLLKSKAMLQD
ncbi:thyroid adenoma-associated protein [Plakobranchus ocellatus]|uniref:Thyroid adenoma-associated protein n=1 Tax=Plakobranchus ocellatus TaxID=259542 RepID=A0AAV3ZH50_9GAST|nr:thyroid adenoma-associated protein [Plakobranchus ocellatus]